MIENKNTCLLLIGVFSTKRDKKEVHEELREGLEVLIQNDIDLIIVEVDIIKLLYWIPLVFISKSLYPLWTLLTFP